MIEDLRDSETLLWLLKQHPRYKVLHLITDGLPYRKVELEWLFQGHLYCLYGLLVIKWQRTTQHGIGDTAKTPDVAGEAIWVLSENLWSNISQGAEGFDSRLIWSNHPGKPKIDYFRYRSIPMISHHYILKF